MKNLIFFSKSKYPNPIRNKNTWTRPEVQKYPNGFYTSILKYPKIQTTLPEPERPPLFITPFLPQFWSKKWRCSNPNSFSPVHLLKIPTFTFFYASRSGICPPKQHSFFYLSHFWWFLKMKNNPIFF